MEKEEKGLHGHHQQHFGIYGDEQEGFYQENWPRNRRRVQGSLSHLNN